LAIFLGALLAYVSHSTYRFLLKRLKNKTLTALLVCLFVFLIIIVPLAFFTKVLVQQSYVLYLIAKQKLAVGLFQGCDNNLCQGLQEFLQNEALTSQIKFFIKTATDWIVKTGSSFLISLPNAVLNLFVIFFALFYFLKDGEKVVRSINSYLHIHHKNFSSLLLRLNEILKGVIYGYLFVGLIQGVLGAIGFFIVGIQSPLFWGLVMAFMSLIPLLGTGLIWAPASLLLILNGIFLGSTSLVIKGIGLFVYSAVLVAGVDNFIRPKLISGKAKVHTAITMLGVFGGIMVFGALGVILGPVILALTVEMIRIYLVEQN
jgi:predicted PurR-regulated permease PerM